MKLNENIPELSKAIAAAIENIYEAIEEDEKDVDDLDAEDTPVGESEKETTAGDEDKGEEKDAEETKVDEAGDEDDDEDDEDFGGDSEAAAVAKTPVGKIIMKFGQQFEEFMDEIQEKFYSGSHISAKKVSAMKEADAKKLVKETEDAIKDFKAALDKMFKALVSEGEEGGDDKPVDTETPEDDDAAEKKTKEVKESQQLTEGKAGNRMLEAAEDGIIEWEEIARECVAQMSTDELDSVAEALGFDDDSIGEAEETKVTETDARDNPDFNFTREVFKAVLMGDFDKGMYGDELNYDGKLVPSTELGEASQGCYEAFNNYMSKHHDEKKLEEEFSRILSYYGNDVPAEVFDEAMKRLMWMATGGR